MFGFGSGDVRILEDDDHEDSPAVAKATTARKYPKGEVIESKTFRDGLIYLYKRSDYKKPTWLCRIKIPGSKGFINRSTGTGDEHRAFKFADDLYNQLLVKSLSGDPVVGKRIGPAIDAYIKRFESQSSRQSIHYKLLLMKRVKPFLGRKVFEDLSTATISQLIDYLIENTAKRSLSPNTVKRIHSDLKHFLNWCHDEGHLAAMPKFPKIAGNQARRPHFNAAEWRKLVEAMFPYVKDSPKNVRRYRHLLMLYIIVLAETGIRVGEARNLKWRDLRPINNSTNPDVANIALMVKGKTGIREVVASGPRVREAFGDALKIRKKDLHDEKSDIYGKDDVPLDSFIFCDKKGQSIGSFKKSFATFIDAIGLTTDTFGQRRTLYSLRHTYATTRIEAGVNHYALAQNMGTSVGMIERFYGHTTNVGMVDELTKPKRRAAKATKTGNTDALNWLSG